MAPRDLSSSDLLRHSVKLVKLILKLSKIDKDLYFQRSDPIISVPRYHVSGSKIGKPCESRTRTLVLYLVYKTLGYEAFEDRTSNIVIICRLHTLKQGRMKELDDEQKDSICRIVISRLGGS